MDFTMKTKKLHKIINQQHIKQMALVLTLLLLSSCNYGYEAPLRIGTNQWPGYEPFYLARTLNYYQNSSIKLVELPSASEVIHALRSGNLEVAALTLDEALLLISEGLDLKVILVTDFSAGGDVLLSKPGIDSLEKLKGKKIAVEYTAVGALLLDSALKAGGLKLTDIQVVGCTLSDHIDCYGSNDAIVTFEPMRTILLDQNATLLYDSSQIPGKIVDVVVTTKEVIDSHPESLSRLISGFFKAHQYLDKNPIKAAQFMSKRMQLSPSKVLNTFKLIQLPSIDENRKLLLGSKSPLQRTAESLSQFMRDRKLLNREILFHNLTNDQFLPLADQ